MPTLYVSKRYSITIRLTRCVTTGKRPPHADSSTKSLAQWIKLATASKLAKHGELVKMRRTDHQLSTKDRLDVGINLKGTEPTEWLEESGSFNAMVSHRVRVTSKSEVNAELKGWLKDAYEAT